MSIFGNAPENLLKCRLCELSNNGNSNANDYNISSHPKYSWAVQISCPNTSHQSWTICSKCEIQYKKMTKTNQLKRHHRRYHLDDTQKRMKRKIEEITEDNEDLDVFTDIDIADTIHVDTNDSIEDLQEKSLKLNNLKSIDIATNVIDAVIPSKKPNLQFPTDKCNDFFIKQKMV